MAPGDPEITVVVASHAERRFLGRCLGSIRSQRKVEWECVVVDDASSDGSHRVALDVAQTDARIRVIRHPMNRGLGAARNTGLIAARAPAVTFLDADDHLLPGSLAARVVALREAPADVIATHGNWVSVAERSWWPLVPRRPRRRPDVLLPTADHATPFIASAPVLRTQLLRAIGGFREDVTTAEDAHLWAWWLRLAGRSQGVPVHAVAYRRRGGSMVRRDLLAHAEANRSAMRELDAPLDLDPSAGVLVLSEAEYREQYAALPRFVVALAGFLHAGRPIPAGALDGFDPVLLRLLRPEALAAGAVATYEGRSPRRRLRRSVRRRLRDEVTDAVGAVAAPPVDEEQLADGAAQLRELRPGRLLGDG
ncbi:MAG: glycosyltransferase family 2 protein [Actinomycetota bacterium]